jgi:hypothetical protein
MSDAYLPNLTHNLLSPHSFLRIPSVRSPNGHPRDFAPTLACTMSWAAKLLPTPTDFTGPKRLLAVASEEGTVSVVDVDRELRGDVDEDGAVYGGGVGTGLARTSPFLDLHQSTIFDIKWSGDDRRLVCPLCAVLYVADFALSSPCPAIRRPVFTTCPALRQSCSRPSTATLHPLKPASSSTLRALQPSTPPVCLRP